MKFEVNAFLPSDQELIKELGLNVGGRVQEVIDSEFMRHLSDYMPKDSGELIKSMHINTKVGDGEIIISTPYVHYVNEGILYVDPVYDIGAFYNEEYGFWSRPGIKKVPSGKELNYQGAPMRGAHFTERMVADHLDDIVRAGQKELDKQ